MGDVLHGAPQQKFAQGMWMGSVISHDEQLRAPVLGTASQ